MLSEATPNNYRNTLLGYGSILPPVELLWLSLQGNTAHIRLILTRMLTYIIWDWERFLAEEMLPGLAEKLESKSEWPSWGALCLLGVWECREYRRQARQARQARQTRCAHMEHAITSIIQGLFRFFAVVCNQCTWLDGQSLEIHDTAKCSKQLQVLSLNVFEHQCTQRSPQFAFNSLTPKSVPAGTKHSRLEGFWLAKHKDTNIPTMMEPFSSPAAWFWWSSVPQPWEPTQKGLDEAAVEGF